MKTSSRRLLLPILLAAVMASPVQAAPSQAGISKQQAVSIAQQQHPGRVLGVKRSGDVYRVKSLSKDGEVRIVVIDANSGRVRTR